MPSKIQRTLLATLLLSATASQPHAADFYAGKTLNIIVGSDVGGGFDAFARMLARHFGSAIPGNPNIVVTNMPGAGSGVAAGFVYSVAPKDGTIIGAFTPGGLLTPLFERRSSGYDTTKFRFLGSANASARLCVSHGPAKIKTYAAATRDKIIVGAGAVGSASFDYAWLHKSVHNGAFNIVAGYKGMADILLAMERGEVEAVCGFDWSSLKAQRPNLKTDGSFNFLLKVSVKPDDELDAMNIPDASSFASNETDRAIGDLVGSQQIFGRPYVVAPGVPQERVEILRSAFDAVMKSPQFIAESATAGLSIDPASGPSVEKAIQSMYAAPAQIIDGARRAIRP